MEQENKQEINTNCGIYLITNLVNGKQYVGQSVNIHHRWICHQNPRDIENTPINLAIKKYGKDSFKFEIIENCLQKELNEKEIYWIKYYNTLVPNGYNIRQGGEQEIIYNYEAIYDKWKEGYLCKELQEIFNCTDKVIHNALLAYGVTQDEIYERSNFHKEEEYYIIALSPIDKKPLKIFESLRDIKKILNLKNISSIKKSIKNPQWKANGYYWIKSKEYIQIENPISDEDFIQNAVKRCNYSEEAKTKFSISNRKVERPSREELKELIRNKSFTQIGKDYKVSGTAIKKWCDFYNLPRRKRDIKTISNEDWINI